MNPLDIVLPAAGLALGYFYALVSISEPENVLMLRKALAESVAQSAERFEEMQVMNDALDAAERERDGWQGCARNLAQVLALHAFECPCDDPTKEALTRAYQTQAAAHNVGDRKSA